MPEHSIAGYMFFHVGMIRSERDRRGSVINDLPQPRYRNERNLPLHKYGRGPFGCFRVAPKWSMSGVYVLTDGDRQALYIGECQNLQNRWNHGFGRISPRNCFQGGQETNCRVNSLIHRGSATDQEFDLWFYPVDGGKRAREAVESDLIAVLKPLWNR